MRKTRNESNRKLFWEQRALWWESQHYAGILRGTSYPNLFAEDVGLEIWRHFNPRRTKPNSDKDEFISLNACSNELRDVLVEAIADTEYFRDMSEVVGMFVQRVSNRLVLKGSAAFEVRLGWDQKDETRQLKAARVLELPDKSLIRVGSRYWQLVLPGNRYDMPEGCLIPLDSKQIVVFRLPTQWRAPLRTMRKQLSLFSKSHDRWLSRMSKLRNDEDVKATGRAYCVALARITAPIGWNASGFFHEYTADCHWAVRELRWKQLCIEIRDEVLVTLASLFSRIGKLCGEEPHLAWKHLPTLQHVRDGEASIRGDGRQFDDIFTPFT